MEVSYGGKSMDHASTWYGPYGENVDVRERHLLLFRRAKLAEGGERVLLRLQQIGRPACYEPKSAPQLMKVLMISMTSTMNK